jgi:hypothetical protein
MEKDAKSTTKNNTASSVMNQLNLKQGLIATLKECTAMKKK